MNESVLFVCENNSILSPMAEAFLRRHCGSTFKVYSAGIEPKSIHLYTFQVMEEIGYELYGYRAKSIFELNHLARVDYLITLSDYVNDYYVFNQDNIGTHLHWPFHNPFHLPGQEYGYFPPQEAKETLGNDPAPAQTEWIPTRCQLIDTAQRTKVILQKPLQETLAEDMKQILDRFRRTRDEMECQIMNWLEENGIGPLWWRG